MKLGLKLKLLILMVILFSCSASKKQESSSEDNFIHFDVQKKVLSNGLTILAVKKDKLPIFSFYTYYKVGGKFERKGLTGATHFLEHMMFKGAKKYGPGEFDKLVEGNGGQNNAYTTNDLTVYYETLPKEHFEVVADLEADRMQNLLLAKDSFEKERLVVLEERRMRYENSDRGKLYLEMMKNVFEGTPYGNSVIGEVEDLKALSRDDVQKYFKKFYAPNNAVIVVVGNLDPEYVFEVISKKYEDIEASDNLEKTKASLVSKEKFKFKENLSETIRLKGTSPNSLFSLAFKGVRIGEKDGFVLDILSSILGDGESSYLNQKYVLGKKSMLQNVYAANYTLQESGTFFIGGQLSDKTSIKKWKKVISRDLKSVCDRVVTPRAMEKVINQYLVSVLKDLDTTAGVARYLGDREVYFGSYEFYKKEFSIYRNIKAEDVVNACKKYLNVDDALFISIGKY